ncbi:Hypothetical protein FKW44_016261, partial [Caligus rogercresseyi]
GIPLAPNPTPTPFVYMKDPTTEKVGLKHAGPPTDLGYSFGCKLYFQPRKA